jgi:hypothetical protein
MRRKSKQDTRAGEELNRVADFVRRTGKAPSGWTLRPHTVWTRMPGSDPEPIPYVDIVSKDETRMISISESSIKKGSNP